MRHDVDERDTFDAIVIGSGFGGAVVAQQLAERGIRDILVLERGTPYPPGSFARTLWEWHENVWAPHAKAPRARRYGLFEILNFPKVTAVLASGLGGGSLIYANVLLEKPPETFGPDEENGWREWPISYAELKPAYDEVWKVFAPETFPYPKDRVPKLSKFGDAARKAGLHSELAPLAIAFRQRAGCNPEPGMPLLTEDGRVDRANLHGRPRRTCTLSGQCDFGCNEGAKNSLDFTFLSDFMLGYENGRKEIRTCCEAKRIAGPYEDGYLVTYEQHRDARRMVEERAEAEGHSSDRLLDYDHRRQVATVHARAVVLAGGTFGSTGLLLRSSTTLPQLSPQLGRGFSSNGDLLKFARHCGDHDDPEVLAPSRGPVITTYAVPKDGAHRVWFEDGGYPVGMEMMWQAPSASRGIWRMRGVARRWLRRRLLGSVADEYIQAIGHPRASVAMMPVLAMGRDVAGGRIGLCDGRLTLDWDPNGASDRYFTSVEDKLGEIAEKLTGRLAGGGWRRYVVPGRGLTAHSLGGCRMGEHVGEGVVDNTGKVFGCEGLYVADGSVMPGAIGPNPSLTIAAVAHLIAGHVADYLRKQP